MKVQSVTDITKKIKSLIETELFMPVSISGEISSFSVSPSGHTYFVLKDENAKIKSVMFKRYRQLTAGYTPKNGDKVVVTGDVRLYEPDGAYQIIVKNITYDSVGDFYKQFEAVKRKLEAEGLFDEGRKKPLPKRIRKIALLTSPTGAAIKDFLVTLQNNSVGFEIDLWPVQVQGATATPGVVRALSHAGRMSDTYDVLVLMRGGGSIEDLSLFNDEFIARALVASAVPTISAIGHERDFSICDFVADQRVATPTAAAESLAEGIVNTVGEIDRQMMVFERSMELRLLKSEQLTDALVAQVERFSPEKQLEVLNEKIAGLLTGMKSRMQTNIRDRYHQYEQNMLKIGQIDLFGKCQVTQQNINYCLEQIRNKMFRLLDRRKGDLEMTLAKIEFLNPELYLDKGYAIVKSNGEAVGGVDQVKLDDELEIILKDGYINSFVTGKRKKQ